MKAKIFILISIVLFGFTPVMAQTISESDVPQDVIVSFKLKYPDANIKTWETSKGNFLAKFNITDQEGIAEFTANGKWIVSRFGIAEKELPSPIFTYYKENYKSREFVIGLSEMVKEGNGDSYYYLQVKKSGISQPKPTELFFDLSGELTKKNEPEENKAVEEVKTDKNPKKTTAAADKGFNKKELPTPINNYIKANYPDHGIKATKFIKDPEMGDVYYILLKEQGYKDQVELYFDINGAMIKKIDSREIKANQTKEVKKTEKNDTVALKEEPKNKTEEPKNKVEKPKKNPEDDTLATIRVPATARTQFTTKFKKATDVKWYRVNRNNVARFKLGGKKGQSTYSEEGNWMETRVETDETTLTTMVIDYLKSNFRRLKILKAENVSQAPKTKYLEVQMVEKNNKGDNTDITKVFFDANGKFSSVERPDTFDPNARDNKKRKDQEDDEFVEKVDATGNPEMNKDQGVNEAIDKKELPTGILRYIKTNYKDLIIKDSRYLFDDDLNTHVYYVTVKKEGDKNEIELYFNLEGTLLKKKVDPTEQKVKNESQVKEDVEVNESVSSGTEKIDPKELPSGIKTYLKQNYSEYKVDEATYKTDDKFGNIYFLVLKKSGTKTIINLYFDLNGKLVKSEKKSGNE